jgi:ATP-dependent RNA helicase SUPV3L1/SUV3
MRDAAYFLQDLNQVLGIELARSAAGRDQLGQFDLHFIPLPRGRSSLVRLGLSNPAGSARQESFGPLYAAHRDADYNGSVAAASSHLWTGGPPSHRTQFSLYSPLVVSRMRAPTAKIGAVLGPTNTGKTHLAVQRLLSHRNGIIGVPLRLLAREIYDRITQEIGTATTALITGEEKRIPRNPRYFICTVESMPTAIPVDFVAVDEIQLAAHYARGHIFTDRILHMRGRLETLFLGADTMTTLLRALVPEVAIDRRPRLSTLQHGGSRRLHQVSDRSALIAFSAADVYAAAEKVKHFHGGAAVVMGALSPRARNAQVALYQAGDVQHIVATDAIGMGLNLDIEHITFLATRKFDGHRFRSLSSAEMAQIAGRAGRFRHDGTFGLISSIPPLPPRQIRAIESHSFPQVTAIYYRNSLLDFSSLDSLRRSLGQTPRFPFLHLQRHGDDQRVLEELAERPEIHSVTRDSESLRLLWEVCGVPDFRGRLGADYVALLGRIFVYLRHGRRRIPSAWMEAQIQHIDRPRGDIETLMSRIAAIRTWTYVAHRADWVEDAPGWQELTRTIEDRLSDALHHALTARFVDRRASTLLRGGRASALEIEICEEEQVVAQGLPCGHLRGLRFYAESGLEQKARLLVERALAPHIEERIRQLVDAADDEIETRCNGEIAWRDQVLGRIRRGPEILKPEVVLAENPLLNGSGRERVRRRLLAAARTFASAVVEPLQRNASAALSPGGRGLVHRLRGSLSPLPRRSLQSLLDSTDNRERRLLARLDIRLGQETVYVRSFLRPASMQARALLWATATGMENPPPSPKSAPASLPAAALSSAAFAEMLGYLRLGPLWVRVDIHERILARLRYRRDGGNARIRDEIQSWLGCSEPQLAGFIAALSSSTRPRPRGRKRHRRRSGLGPGAVT